MPAVPTPFIRGGRPIFRVSVMYAGRDGGTFDLDYYAKAHMALVRERLGSTPQMQISEILG